MKGNLYLQFMTYWIMHWGLWIWFCIVYWISFMLAGCLLLRSFHFISFQFVLSISTHTPSPKHLINHLVWNNFWKCTELKWIGSEWEIEWIGNEQDFYWKWLAVQAANFMYYPFIHYFFEICGVPSFPMDLVVEIVFKQETYREKTWPVGRWTWKGDA